MIRALALTLSLLAGPALAEDAVDPVEAARAESDRYPQDYAAALRLAAAATDAGDHEAALLGWDRAVAVSGGNPDAHRGRVFTLLALGRGEEARAASLQLLEKDGRAGSWITRGWALRNATGLAPAPWYLVASEAAYRRAAATGDRTGRCGLAWTRLLLGDRIGARLAFGELVEEDLGDTCAVDGGAAAAPRVRFGGAWNVTGSFTTGDSATSPGGFSVLGTAWGTIDDLVTFRVAGRGIASDPAGDDYRQWELWGGATVAQRGFGAEFLGAVLGSNDREDRRFVIGGRAWATFGVTGVFEASRGIWTDENVTNLGGLVKVPTTSFLTLNFGGSASWSDRPPPPVYGDGPPPLFVLPSFRIGADLTSGPGDKGVDVTLDARLGREHRPIRFDDPTAWNVLGDLVGSLDIDARVRLPSGGGLLLGYEVAGIQHAGETAYQTHLITVGLSVGGTGDLP